jgi:hypothetical protein
MSNNHGSAKGRKTFSKLAKAQRTPTDVRISQDQTEQTTLLLASTLRGSHLSKARLYWQPRAKEADLQDHRWLQVNQCTHCSISLQAGIKAGIQTMRKLQSIQNAANP